jgi:hypothetical protein
VLQERLAVASGAESPWEIGDRRQVHDQNIGETATRERLWESSFSRFFNVSF